MANSKKDPELVSAFDRKDITTLRSLLTSKEFEPLEEWDWTILRASQLGSVELVELIASKGVSLEGALHAATKFQVK